MLMYACTSFGQPSDDEIKSFGYLTFYYVDNSDGYNADPLNDDMVQELKDNLNKLNNRNDNYFFFYGCNGDENKTSFNLASFNGSPSLKKYLASPSRESDFNFDKQTIRNYFIEYPVKIKQSVEINMYLSTFAAQRLVNKIEDLPTPLVLANELPIYLNTKSSNELRIKINVFINKEAKELVGEEKIRSSFSFCNKNLGLEYLQPSIVFL